MHQISAYQEKGLPVPKRLLSTSKIYKKRRLIVIQNLAGLHTKFFLKAFGKI